jgi:hypothetical protein
MITRTNAFSATVGWIGSPGQSSFAASRSCHSPIAGNNFLQRLVGGLRAASARKKNRQYVGETAIIAPILLEGWWDMRRLSLCCSISLGVVFEPRSHTRYPPYELMSRNWYVSFCWTWYQRKRESCRSIPDEKSKTIPVPGGVVLSSFRIECQLCPGLKSGTQRVPRHISPYCPRNSAYTDWFSPVVLSVAFPFARG